MKIIEVKDKKTANLFLKVPRILYKNDPHWVCPLDSTIEDVFNPQNNIFFKHGEATRWILTENNGNLIGRVAAFINKKKAYNFKQPTGGMGFFECINDKNAAFMLFDKCKEWLKERGMEAMDGPINFGENDNFWGLLVEGFMPQSYGMNYNFSYYKSFFEDYGFQSYFEQVSNHLDLTKPFPERFWKIAGWIRKKPGYKYEHFRFKDAEKFIKDLKEVYDNAWKFHENFTPIEIDDMKKTLKKAKAIIDEEFIWFAYKDNTPIAFLIMLPDFNQILKYMNGKMHIFNKLKFLYLKYKKTITRSRITIMGVIPEFQKSGIESAIFWNMQKVMDRKTHYTEIELSWVGDFNPKMRALHDSVGASFAKKHITYRKLFDESKKYYKSDVTKEKAVDK
jgi:hypothetical protein